MSEFRPLVYWAMGVWFVVAVIGWTGYALFRPPTVRAQYVPPPPVKVGNLTTFASGIYYMDSINIPAGETWAGNWGMDDINAGRTIITRSDGRPVQINNNGTLKNIWVGGTRENHDEITINAGDNSVFDGDTFWGYWGGINGGSHINPKIINSRFVNMGGGLYSHPIYINNYNATAGQGATITDNIFIGGEGYPIHLYHSPNYNDVERNFVGGGMRCIAVTGHHNTVKGNIFWSNSDYACVYIDADNEDYGSSNLVFNHNLIGAATTTHWYYPAPDSIIKNNWFVGNAFIFGTQPQHVAKSDLPTYLDGASAADINLHISRLQTSFSYTSLDDLWHDVYAAGDFHMLHNAVLGWAN